jgi:anti-sigma-K factor RskA
MPPDISGELGHPDAAAWALGALDPEEAGRFQAHLQSCGGCRTAVAEFEQVAQALAHPPPEIEPPPDLQARTLARVAQAARGAGRNGRWRSWSTRMLVLAASVIVAAGTTIGLLLSGGTPAETYALALHSGTGLSASASGTTRQADGGWSVQLTALHLPEPGPGQFYQCWWVGPGNRPGNPSLVSAGTFTVGPSGTASIQMWTAADPDDFPEVEITLDSAAQPGQPGRVVLSGTVDDED